jgi:transcriptional regulator with XRE-family HTH domain
VYNPIFFTNVLRLSEEQGLNKNDLAIEAGISVSFLSDLTNGKGNPSLKIMQGIADALGTSLALLLESTDLDPASLSELGEGRVASSLRWSSNFGHHDRLVRCHFPFVDGGRQIAQC